MSLKRSKLPSLVAIAVIIVALLLQWFVIREQDHEWRILEGQLQEIRDSQKQIHQDIQDLINKIDEFLQQETTKIK